MSGGDQSGAVTWRNGTVPVSTRFDDPYYSLEDGLAETRHVFLDGNDLPARLRPGFQVAELGVGTGLNLLALADCAEQAGVGKIHYCGFEAFPLDRRTLARALEPFVSLRGLADTLIETWDPAGFVARIGPIEATMLAGDARQNVPDWTGSADAWFLDGFAPARNPELWEPALMRAVAHKTTANGSFATYTAAGAVRRSLTAAGFEVERRAGFGRKRHMSIGRMPA